MTDPSELLTPLVAETQRTLDDMAKTADLQQRQLQSEIIKNLCHSLGVFLDAMAAAQAQTQDDDLDDVFPGLFDTDKD